MENRERDKMSDNRSTSSNQGKEKSKWDKEPEKRSGSMSGDSGRSSNLGEQSDVSSNRSGSSSKTEH